jgi:hypothetical protein
LPRRAAESGEETLRTQLALGQLFLLEGARDLVQTRTLFQQVKASALATAEPVLQAEALLRLTELDFDAQPVQPPGIPQHLEPFPLYQQALTLFEQAGSAEGQPMSCSAEEY